MKIDYEYKALVMRQGYCIKEKKLSYKGFKIEQEIDKGKKDLQAYYDFLDNEASPFYRTLEGKEARKINHASNSRTWRLKCRIEFMLASKKALFLTFTFTDACLSSTTSETRKQYVRKYCKKWGAYYIANIDFGARKGREHYHAVLVPYETKIDYSAWNYGAINGEKVRSINDSKPLARYVNKLTNHAIKDTAKGNRIIYSRFT